MATRKPDNNELTEFLRGMGDDQSAERCEKLLSNTATDTVTNIAETVGDDSLLAALRIGGSGIPVDDPQLENLAGSIEALVPRHVITAEEISRVMDSPQSPDSIGRIGRFDVIEFLASGGMGLVFRAIDPELKRDVCIKLLSPNHEFSPEAKSRFDRESREMAAMNCERIVTVLEVGRQNGLPYFVMPLLAGHSLRTLIDRKGELSAQQSVTIIGQLAEGLHYAHQRGVLHRDIKPDNLWILPGGDIKILDFGLAHIDGDASPITHSGTVIGTPSYMSPEQVNGKPLDRRSDLFSVGVVLTEMLTGKSPFQKTNLFSTLMSVASEKVEISQLDPENRIDQPLRDVLVGLLEKDPGQRTASAAALSEQLNAIASKRPLPHTRKAATPSAGQSFTKWVAAAAAGFAICLAAIAAWQLTDKGTLVVSTDDPSVEVHIANEQVTVIDPVTEKRYEIRIGETPLPSGVYQLEASNDESELAFSSQTIAIRRGEQSIVTVELIPKSEPPESNIAATSPSTGETSIKTSSTGKSAWADITRDESAYTESGQQAIAAKLAGLPGLDLRQLGFASNDAIGEHATVGSKTDRTLVSLAHAVVDDQSWHSNADGSRMAHAQQGWIQIRNAKLDKLQMMIPIPGSRGIPYWDPENPNLLAVSSYLPEALRAANAGQKYAIFVWALGHRGTKLLRVYPAQSNSVLLDRGYRLFCFDDNAVKAHSLVDGKSWQVPDSSGESFYRTPMSPNGQYLTTYSVPGEQTQYSIFDLKAGKLIQAIHGPQRIQWSADSTQLAGFVRDRNRSSTGETPGHIDIIDVASGNSIRRIEPDKFSRAAGRLALSPDFEVLANAVSDGDVLLMDIKNGRKSKIGVDFLSTGENTYRGLQYSDKSGLQRSIAWLDNSRLEIKGAQRRWHFVRGQGISGKLVPDERHIEEKPQSILRSSIRHLSTLGDGTLAAIAGVYPEKGHKDSSFFSLKIDEVGVLESRPIWGHLINGAYLAGEDIHSPSGKFVVQISKKNGRHDGDRFGRYAADVWVQNLELENELAKIGTFESVSEIAWSLDEKFLVVEGWQKTQRHSGPGARIIDLQTMKPLPVKGIWDESARDFIPFKSGFLCSAAYHQQASNRWESKLFFMDLSQTDADKLLVNIGELNDLGEFQSCWVQESVDGRRITTIKPHEEEKPERVFEIGEQFKLKELSSKPEFANLHQWQFNSASKTISSLMKQLQAKTWTRHPDRPTKICFAGEEGTALFDLADDQRIGPLFGHKTKFARTPAPCKEGWILWSDSMIFVVDFEGNLLRQKYLYIDTTTKKLTATNWVHRNGDGLEALREQHNNPNEFPLIRFQDGEYRIE